MGPDYEEKPSIMGGGRMVEVTQEELEDLESCILRLQGQVEDICSSDLISNSSLGDSNDAQESASQFQTSQAVRVLATKKDDVKWLTELVLLKLRNMMPRQKGSSEDVSSNLNLKRSRPLSPLLVPRVPGIAGPLDSSKVEPGLSEGSAPVEPVPLLKYIKTNDNTKAPFQKPSTIFMPIAKLAMPTDSVLPLGPSSVPLVVKPSCNVLKSPKKRPSRSRRDRNRARSKVVIVPEPVVQKLNPGDTNKIPEDGYLWRKYGNKPIKTASYKRGYYKCRFSKDSEVKCQATKVVQQTNEDPGTFHVTYKGDHTCKQQGLGPSGLSQGGPGQDVATLADQISNGEGPDEKGNDKDEGLEWAENSCDSDSDDMFPSEGGDDAVESSRTPHEVPASPLLQDFEMQPIATESSLDFQMPAIENRSDIVETEVSHWQETVTTGGNGAFKTKYQSIETCPPEADIFDLDESNQLLKLIGGCLWDNPSDINYWNIDSNTDFPMIL